ncbi:MAG: hypothetical protein R3F61_14625 [Myxococcota bacterium]
MWWGLLAAQGSVPAPGPQATDCAPCHAEITAQWRASRHAQAATNPVFRASWEHWPNGWCLECHAPRPEQQVSLLGHVARAGVLQQLDPAPAPGVWQDGVDCATCHVRDGRIRTANAPSEAASAMHDLVHDPSLATEAACEGCHEFAFQRHTPRLPFAYGDALAQSTVTEWRASRAHAEGRTCQDCHMGEHGHGFPGAHDEDLVREAVRVTAVRRGGDLVVGVSAPGVGHAVPSGDPFRRLELHVCADAACSETTAVAWFLRTLERTATSWQTDRDLRVPVDGTREVSVAIPPGARAWQLLVRYGDRRFEPDLPDAEVGYVLAQGDIPRE